MNISLMISSRISRPGGRSPAPDHRGLNPTGGRQGRLPAAADLGRSMIRAAATTDSSGPIVTEARTSGQRRSCPDRFRASQRRHHGSALAFGCSWNPCFAAGPPLRPPPQDAHWRPGPAGRSRRLAMGPADSLNGVVDAAGDDVGGHHLAYLAGHRPSDVSDDLDPLPSRSRGAGRIRKGRFVTPEREGPSRAGVAVSITGRRSAAQPTPCPRPRREHADRPVRVPMTRWHLLQGGDMDPGRGGEQFQDQASSINLPPPGDIELGNIHPLCIPGVQGVAIISTWHETESETSSRTGDALDTPAGDRDLHGWLACRR